MKETTNVIKLNVEELKKFCDKAKKIVKGRQSLPILEMVMIENGTLRVSDLQTTLSQGFEDLGDFYGTLPLKELAKLVGVLPKGSYLSIHIDTLISKSTQAPQNDLKTFKAVIVTDKGMFTWVVQDPDEYPSLHNTPETYGILYKEEIPLIKKAANYASKNELWVRYLPVYLQGRHILATDSMVLCYYDSVGERDKPIGIHPTIIPLLEEVEYSILTNDEMDVVSLECKETKSIISYRLSTEGIGKWEHITEGDPVSTFHISSKELLEVLKVGVLALPDNGNIMFTNMPSNSELNISILNRAEDKTFTKNIKVDNAGTRMRIGVNYFDLFRIANTEGGDLSFNLVSDNQAFFINNNLVVMPVMLED